jgi:hypothetical protein
MQQVGAERLIRAVAGMIGASVMIAMLNVATLLAERSGARSRSFAIRAAHGASTSRLVHMLLSELRVLLAGAVSLGVPAGLALGFAMRAAWPGTMRSPLSGVPGDLLAALVLLLGVVSAAHVIAALRSTRDDRLASSLRSGTRAGWDPAAVFVRRALSATHVAVAGAVAVTAWALAIAMPSPNLTPDTIGDRALFVIPVENPEPHSWPEVLSSLDGQPGLEAESLATPGALVGLGIRDMTITECGQCVIGVTPAPLWNASTEVHAVGPDFHGLTGINVLEGRAFDATDSGSAPLVALVSRRLANVAFEDGLAIGKRLRVGDELETWYTVVGIVEDRSVRVPGEDGSIRGAVYLNALQRPPRHGRLLVLAEGGGVTSAVSTLRSAGIRTGEAMEVDEYVAHTAAPIRWASLLVQLTGLLVLLLGTHGVYLSALQTTRRRARDMALRSALGAPTHAVARSVVGERLRTTGWGLVGLVFLGTLVSAGLEKASGAPAIGPGGYLVVSLGALAIVLAASVRAVREALGVQPATLLD